LDENWEGSLHFEKFGYFRGVFLSKALPRFCGKIFNKQSVCKIMNDIIFIWMI